MGNRRNTSSRTASRLPTIYEPNHDEDLSVSSSSSTGMPSLFYDEEQGSTPPSSDNSGFIEEHDIDDDADHHIVVPRQAVSSLQNDDDDDEYRGQKTKRKKQLQTGLLLALVLVALAATTGFRPSKRVQSPGKSNNPDPSLGSNNKETTSTAAPSATATQSPTSATTTAIPTAAPTARKVNKPTTTRAPTLAPTVDLSDNLFPSSGTVLTLAPTAVTGITAAPTLCPEFPVTIITDGDDALSLPSSPLSRRTATKVYQVTATMHAPSLQCTLEESSSSPLEVTLECPSSSAAALASSNITLIQAGSDDILCEQQGNFRLSCSRKALSPATASTNSERRIDVTVACQGQDASLQVTVPPVTATCDFATTQDQLEVEVGAHVVCDLDGGDDSDTNDTEVEVVETQVMCYSKGSIAAATTSCTSTSQVCEPDNDGLILSSRCQLVASAVTLAIDTAAVADYCARGTRTVGQICTTDTQCASDVCLLGVCWSGWICDGGPCDRDDHCQSGFCHGDGTCHPAERPSEPTDSPIFPGEGDGSEEETSISITAPATVSSTP